MFGEETYDFEENVSNKLGRGKIGAQFLLLQLLERGLVRR